MKVLALAALLAAGCPQRGDPTGPTPTPAPPVPAPTATVSVPTPSVDAGTPAPGPATCATAYSRMWALMCPPAEDAHLGWVEFDCPKLDKLQVSCVANAENCQAARACQE